MTFSRAIPPSDRCGLTPPRSLVPEIGEEVESAIMAALDPDTGRRTASCLAFFKHLTTRRPDGPAAAESAPAFPGRERRHVPRFSCRLGGCAVVETNLHGGGEEKWPLVARDASHHGLGILLARRF